MMRGLIYRELYLGRKAYLGGFAAYIAVMIFGVLVRMSLLYGNLARLSPINFNSTENITYNVFSILPGFLIMFGLVCENGVIASDYKAKWNIFSYTLPVSEERFALMKYGIKAAGMLAALILAMANAALISTLYGRKINTAVLLVILLITVIAAFVSCAQTPLAVKYRTSNAVAIRLFVAAVVIYVAIMCSMAACVNSFMKAHEGEDEDKAMSLFVNMLTDALVNIKHVLYIVLPILLVAAYVLGYMFTVKYLKRREN